MQKFEYRGARFAVDLPVRFAGGNRTLVGRCIEMSKEGLRLDLGEQLDSDSCGKVFLVHQGRTLEFSVRVIHAGAKFCGMEFIYSSEAEQNELAHLVESLAVPQTRPGPVLLKSS